MSSKIETTDLPGAGKPHVASAPIFNNEELIANYSFFAVKCFCDHDFTIEDITNGVEDFGYIKDALIIEKKSLSCLIFEKDMKLFRDVYDNCTEQKEANFFGEFRIKKQSGIAKTMCHVSIIYSGMEPVRIECVFIDITEKKENGRNLKSLTANLSGNDLCICQHSTDCDGNLKIDFITDNIRLYGYHKGQLIDSDLTVFDVLHTDDHKSFKKQLSLINKNGETLFNNTFRIVLGENRVKWVLFETIAVSKNGKLSTLTAILHDIDEQKNATKTLFEIKRSLSTSLKQSQFVIDVLKHIQVTSNYDDALRLILKKLAVFASISSLEFIIPFTTDKTVYKRYCYNNEISEFEFMDIDIENYLKKYPNIINRIKTYGTAYSDAYCVSKNCEDEFKSASYSAALVYAVNLPQGEQGCLILSDSNSARTWDNETISLINNISQIVSGLFHRFFTQSALVAAKNIFKTVLDSIDAYVFVTDPNDDSIIFTNKKFDDNFPNMDLSGTRLELMKHKCALINNSACEKSGPSEYEFFCDITNQWLDVTETFITWHDEMPVRLITMYDISQKIEYEKMIEKQAYNDHLTDLPNRRMLEKDFPVILERAIRSNSYGYILFLDLDNFKNVNDGLGHQYGDSLLISIADFFRSIESTGNHSYRFGGDEFAIILTHENKDNINSIVKTLLDRFQLKWHVLDTTYFCTMSMGIAKFPYDGTSLLDIMKKVDMAMYSAKKLGKNRVLHYKSKIGFDSIRNIEMERYLRESVTNNFHGFSVHYQPIINTKTKELVGAEALCRWNCENLGMISPGEFIPMAENIGLIVPIGDFMLREACKQCKKWIASGYPDFKMNVNLSVDQLVQPDVVEHLKKIIADAKVPFKNISLEVTESIAVNDMKKMIEILKALSSLGINIALDDFGTGYSSLNNIKDMPLSTIKIDKSFIDDLSTNTSTEIFVKTIISLAHALGMKVCAEGVEQEIQYNRLAELNADVIQGYFFGKPIPAGDFESKYSITLKK